MTIHLHTTQEKLAEVERLIEEERRMTGRRNEVLRSIGADLRGRLEDAPTVTLVELERRMVGVVRSKRGGHYDDGNMIGLAQEVVGRWTSIRQALERFGAEVDQGGS